MQAFAFNTSAAIVFGQGSSRDLMSHCQRRGATSVLVVTDPLLVQLGLLEPALAGFDASSIAVTVFDQVREDPPVEVVESAVAIARSCNADMVVGFGGGSSMDVAKLVALLASLECQQTLPDIYGVDQAVGKRLPLIQVPTTAGTGSEVTAVSIVTTGKTTKSGVVSPLLLPDLAILDAELTVGLPAAGTAATGIDAMVHAIEAYTTAHKKNPLSDMLAREALRLLAGSLRQAVSDGSDIDARSDMLLGAMLAGQAFANAPVAAVHALAYPLGGVFHIPHGLSNSLVLPEVLKFNRGSALAAEQYAELAPIILGGLGGEGSGAGAMIDVLAALPTELGIPARLRDANVPQDALAGLARDAMLQQRLLVNNPREMTEADALAIYEASW